MYDKYHCRNNIKAQLRLRQNSNTYCPSNLVNRQNFDRTENKISSSVRKTKGNKLWQT